MKRQSSASLLTLAVVSAAVALGGCGNTDGKTGKGRTPSVAAAAGSEATKEKFNLYVDAFNGLIDDNWGVSENFNDYKELDLPNASPSDSISFPENISTLNTALGKLREGRALRGGNQSQAADAAADKVIEQGAVLLAKWQELGPYFESRGYRTDNLAKGKAEHAALMTAYEKTMAAIDELDAALTTYLRARDEAQLAELRREGHTDLANLMLAMQRADHFTDAVIENNAAEADRLLPEFEAAVAELRKSQTTIAADADADNKVEFDLIAGYLTNIIGDWRDYKQSHSDSERESILDSYNNAVNQMGDVEIPA